MRQKHPRTGATAALPAAAWLGRNAVGASVLATARTLLQVEHLLHQAMPASVGAHCRACRLDGQRLTLQVPGASHAARLRQLTPRLIALLNQRGFSVKEMVVRIEASAGPVPPATRPRRVAPIDATALQAFTALRQHVTPGPLADALARLIEHHTAR